MDTEWEEAYFADAPERNAMENEDRVIASLHVRCSNCGESWPEYIYLWEDVDDVREFWGRGERFCDACHDARLSALAASDDDVPF